MSKMLQIRDVPDKVHSVLKARAAHEGMSLSDFVKRELQHVAEKPSLREWLAAAQNVKPVATTQSAVQVIRRLRDSG